MQGEWITIEAATTQRLFEVPLRDKHAEDSGYLYRLGGPGHRNVGDEPGLRPWW